LKRLKMYLMAFTMGLLLLTACSVETGSSDQIEANQTIIENEDKAVENIDDVDNLEEALPVIEDNPDSNELQLIEPKVYAGQRHTLALKADGTLWSWGSNDEGQLGSGLRTTYLDYSEMYEHADSGKAFVVKENADALSPVKVMDEIIDASAGGSASYAVTQEHELYVWGNNEFEQLGIAGIDRLLTPTKLMDGVVDVEAGALQAAVIKEDGSLWFFGYEPKAMEVDEEGHVIQPIVQPFKLMDHIQKASVTVNGIMALTDTSDLYIWGNGDVVGFEYSETPNLYVDEPVKVLSGITEISCKGQVNMAVDQNGDLYTWGFNGDSGMLGTGTDEFYVSTPQRVMGDVAQITESSALTKDGTFYTWGDIDESYASMSSMGETGGGILDVLVDYGDKPVAVFHDAAFIERDDRIYVIDKEGMLWGLGQNQFGKLGDGTATTYSYELMDDGEFSMLFYSILENHDKQDWVQIMSLVE